MVEDNVYSWSVFFAILAIPGIAIASRIVNDIKRYLKQQQKEAKLRAEALQRMEEMNNPSKPEEVKAKPTGRADKHFEEQLEAARLLQQAADEERKKNLGKPSTPHTGSVEKAGDEVCYNQGPWTESELSALAKALKKYPGGTIDRWPKVSKMVITRDVKAVMVQAGTMKKHGGVIENKAPVWRDSPIAAGKTTTCSSTIQADPVAPAVSWSPEQQKQLEIAIKKYPNTAGASSGDRWVLIAGDVDGKTKKECVARYKEIAALVKKQRGSG